MPAYKNTYKPPPPAVDLLPRDIHLHTPLEEYDHNFCFDVRELHSGRVELRPFIPSLHAQLLLDGVQACDQNALWGWLPVTRWDTLSDVLVWAESYVRTNPADLLYAIFSAPRGSTEAVDPKDYSLAGVCAIVNANRTTLTADLGWMVVLEPFQRSHVSTHTSGLLMHRVLDMPAEGGLGLRRCMWGSSFMNDKSKAAALRLGFKHEGILRSLRVPADGKNGTRPGRKGDLRENCASADSWWSSVIWEEWEGGVREHVDRLMARKS
ncbi:hypothetical protein IAT38_005183 [Cryptococcus sp. DSM 104549]